MQYLLVKVGEEKFALKSDDVLQIENVLTITRLPYVADYVEGVINLDGEVLPQINLRKLLGYPERGEGEGELVISYAGDFKMAIKVDEVLDRYHIEDEEVTETLSIEATAEDSVNYIERELMFDGSSVFLLNVDSLNELVKPEQDGTDEGSLLGVYHDAGIEIDNKKGFLLFKIGSEVMAIELTDVTEVLEEEAMTIIPGMPNYVKGLMNLRGDPLLVVSGRNYLEITSDFEGLEQVLIFEKGDITCGISVDEIIGIRRFDEKMIHEEKAEGYIKSYVIDTAEKIILMVDLATLIAGEKFDAVKHVIPVVNKNKAAEIEEKQKMLLTMIDEEIYAFDVMQVTRIIEEPYKQEVFSEGSSIVGSIDIDGKIIPTLNLCNKLNSPNDTVLEKLIVVDYHGSQWGIWVTEAERLVDIAVKNIDYNASKKEVVKGVARYKDQLISLLSFEWLVESAAILPDSGGAS